MSLVRRVPRALLAVAALDWAIAWALLLGRAETPVAVPLLVTAATVLVLLQVSRVRRVVRAVRSDRAASRWAAAQDALGREWSPRAARVLLREPRLLWSVVLLVRGRRDGVPPAIGFGGHRDAMPAWVVIGAVAVVEIGVTAALPLPAVAHRILFVAGLWGAVVVLGLVAALVVHPHLLVDDQLLLRSGFWAELAVPRVAVTRARTVIRSGGRGLTVAGGCATVSPSGTTNLVLTLAQPVAVQGREVTEIRLWADDPDALAAALRPAGA